MNIVVSSTHADVRAEHCVRAAETGRHIVIEKPIGLEPAQTEAIREAVAKAGVKTVTSFVLRWNPQFVTVQRMIEDGALGELVYGEADYWHPLQSDLPGYESKVSRRRARSSIVFGGWSFPTIEPDSPNVAHHPFREEIEHFVDCIERGVESHASIHDTYKTMAVCFAIDESAAKGETPVQVKLG